MGLNSMVENLCALVDQPDHAFWSYTPQSFSKDKHELQQSKLWLHSILKNILTIFFHIHHHSSPLKIDANVALPILADANGVPTETMIKIATETNSEITNVPQINIWPDVDQTSLMKTLWMTWLANIPLLVTCHSSMKAKNLDMRTVVNGF